MLGTIQSALVLGQARDAHLGEFLSNPFQDKGVCDEWFVDDGQVFVRSFHLRALDVRPSMAPAGNGTFPFFVNCT